MLRAFVGALSLLTTIPTPNYYPDEPGRAYAWFPLVGVLLGGLLWGVWWGAMRVFPPDVAAFVVVAAWVLLTGGLHLDGFGDACDGLFATVPRERRLEIMKDSRAGSWAVVGLGLLLLGKWVGVGAAPPSALLLAAVTGRAVMVAATVGLPYARQTGMGGYFRQGITRREVVIAGLTLAVVLACFPPGTLAATAATLLPVGGAAWWANRRLGGLTGDVYGALCELSELLVLLALAAG